MPGGALDARKRIQKIYHNTLTLALEGIGKWGVHQGKQHITTLRKMGDTLEEMG